MPTIKKALYECKQCKTEMIDYPQFSGNNIGARVYSDFFSDGTMEIPFDEDYIVCSTCKKVYKRDEIFLKFINEDDNLDMDDDDLEIPFYFRVKMGIINKEEKIPHPVGGIEKIKAIITSHKLNIERESSLLWYLWHINHNSDIKEVHKEKY